VPDPDPPRPSDLGVAVLGLLYGGPLHPYRMQRLLKDWGKDQVVAAGQRSTLYKAIKRLHDHGLIAVRTTERDQLYPERTVYELTTLGRRLVLVWLDELIARPRNEYPSFPAALSFAMLLGPSRARAALGRRAESLRGALGALDAQLAQHGLGLPRISQLETEYLRAMTAAELAWVDGIITELGDGTLDWTEADFAGAGEAYRLDEPSG
jgi:DNA-binding PadR family transcriptional regulator